jgi:hypothetical protein
MNELENKEELRDDYFLKVALEIAGKGTPIDSV